MKFICAIIITFLVLIFIPYSAYASDGPVLYYHTGPDGTLTLFAQDKDSFDHTWTKLELHKVFTADNKANYFIRFFRAADDPVSSLKLVLDGKPYVLNPLPGTQEILSAGGIQQWYQVDDNVVAALANVKKVKEEVQFVSGKVYKNSTYRSFADSVRQLITLDSGNYLNQKNVESADTGTFTVFIPGVTPKDVAAALIYNRNYSNSSGTDKFLNNYQVYVSGDWQLMEFDSKRDSDRTFIFLQPQNGGVWVRLTNTEHSVTILIVPVTVYSGTSSMIEYIPETQINDYYVDPWRSTKGMSGAELGDVNSWVDSISEVYKLFYGSYDYGLEWSNPAVETEKKKALLDKWASGPFIIRSVNAVEFPELKGIIPGDTITEINGVSTKSIAYPESLLLTVYNTKPATFTICDSSGNLKQKITITPKLIPATGMKRDYWETVKNDKQFKKFDDPNIARTDMSYNPLGSVQ